MTASDDADDGLPAYIEAFLRCGFADVRPNLSVVGSFIGWSRRRRRVLTPKARRCTTVRSAPSQPVHAVGVLVDLTRQLGTGFMLVG